nr:hypothetical protein [uncultured Flavobacterium sp.]
MKTESLALIGMTSFCGGVRHKRYNGQQEIAPNSSTGKLANLKLLQNKKRPNRS